MKMTLRVRKKRITLLGSLIALVLVVALACSSDDETAPAAATGPTASEIAAAVAATIPEGVSATAISGMIDSALSANPGVSAAELQAAIKAGAGDDLSSADVSAIVKAALNAQPAPQVDTSAIAGLVESAVASAIPEGTDAAEIADLVSAAVEGATSGIATSGDVATAIAAALAGQDNLTGAQVAAIVDASLESLRAAVAAQGESIATLELASLPDVGASEGGYSKVLLPELERPTNIPADLVLAEVQELNFLYQSGAKEGVTPPYVEGGGDRSMYPWIFMPPFQMASIEKNFALRQGFATGYSISDDGLTYLLHINPDAIFQDGTAITAQSVKDAWEYAAWPENQVGWGAILLHTRAIEGMNAIESGDTLTTSGLNAIDDVTLEITMVKFTPTWPLQMAVWMLGVFKTDQAINDPEGFRLSPIGAGPYRATYFDDTAKQEYTATANWWGQAPVIKKIHRPTITDLQTGYIMYENGEIDVLYADSVRQPAIWQPANPYHGDLVPNGGKGLWYTAYVTDHEPFDDINIRKALAHGADMWNIVPAILGPLAEYGAGIITSGNACWQAGTGYEYDPALAQQALADSKYGTAANVPSITIEISRPSIIRIFEVVQEQWKDNLGIEINLTRLEPGQVRRDVVEFRRQSLGARIPDPSGILSDLGHSTSGTVKNSGKFSNPQLDALIDAAGAMSLTDPAYCSAWQEIERTIMDNYYYFPLMAGDPSTWVLQPWVKGYVGSLGQYMNTLPWWQIGVKERDLYQ
jgi:ABC-type oligopeptide transport system substrate-binding subunit